MDLIECNAFLGGTKLFPKDQLRFRPAVYGLVQHGQEVLLVRGWRNGKYGLPGGGVAPGERLEAALKREVREETGIEVEVGEMLFFKEDFFYYDPGDRAYHSFLFFFHCTPKTFELASNEQIEDKEVVDPCWVPVSNLRVDDFEGHKELVFSALQGLPGVRPE